MATKALVALGVAFAVLLVLTHTKKYTYGTRMKMACVEIMRVLQACGFVDTCVTFLCPH